MNINTKEVDNCDSSLLLQNKHVRIRIVLHINYDPISRGYVGCFLALAYLLAPIGCTLGFLVQSHSSCLFFTVVSRN